MSRFSSFLEVKREIGGDDPGFRVSVFLSFGVVFYEQEDVYWVAGKLCAGFFHGPGTSPFGIEAVFFLHRIDGPRRGCEQRSGLLQHVAKKLGITGPTPKPWTQG